MNTISRYILRNIAIATIFITVALSFAIWLNQVLKFLELAAGGNAPIKTFLTLIMLSLPHFLFVILPLATTIATIFVFNKLNQDSELNVMRAAGISNWKLAQPVLIFGLFIAVLVLIIAGFVAPKSAYEFEERKDEIIAQMSSAMVREGVFNSLTDGLTVYAETHYNDAYQELLIVDSRDTNKTDTIMAREGQLIERDDGLHLLLTNVIQQTKRIGRNQIETVSFGSHDLSLNMFREVRGPRWPKARERTIPELFAEPITPLDIRYADSFRIEGHTRLSLPLISLAFVLIACVGMLSGEYSRRGQAPRITFILLSIIILQGGAMALQNLVPREGALISLLYIWPITIILLTSWLLINPNAANRVNSVLSKIWEKSGAKIFALFSSDTPQIGGNQ